MTTPVRPTSPVPPTLERRVRQQVEDWVHKHESVWGRLVATASSASRAALSPVTSLAPVERALQSTTNRIMNQAQIAEQIDQRHLQRLDELSDDPAARLTLAEGRSADIRRRRRFVMGAQTATTGAASATPLTATVAFASDLVTVTLGLLHTAGGVLAAHGIADDDLVPLAVGTTLLASERRPGERRRGLERLWHGRTGEEGSAGDVAAGQAGPRLAADAAESLVRRTAGRRVAGAAPLVGAVAGAASTVWMIDAVVDTANQIGALRLLDLDPTPGGA